MAALNPLTRELVFKIVFYGPGLGGKTTTLQAIHERTKPEHRGKLVSLATPTERTLYFDFLPVRVPRIRNLNVRLQLFTVPGQVYFSATRKLVLTGADGIVFVADSQPARMDANQESVEDLSGNLAEHGRSLSQIPHTFHWNKRDIEEVVSEGELDRRFNLFAAPTTATVAPRGVGVFEGLEKITRLVMENYRSSMPHNEATSSVSLDADELGIEEAVRELAESSPAPEVGPRSPPAPKRTSSSSQTRVSPAPTSSPKVAPVVDAPPPSSRGPMPAVSPLPPTRDFQVEASFKRTSSAPEMAATVSPPPPALPGSLSFAELWPQDERIAVRRVEASLGEGDYGGAILACDVLVARVLASGASIAGTLEAPRDPAVVVMLLGLPGPRYLAFRTAVRKARRKEPVGSREAFECYLFALEARQARASLDR
ncbi:MAG TPA: gliding motility protein [Polyangiaceae bacterium]|nr:gliding motility protein [Polyangiaceae bacterium]